MARVGPHQVVDDRLRLAPGALAGAHPVGVLPQQAQVNHEV